MSPRPGPRMPLIAVRLDAELLAWLDEQVAANGSDRSKEIRAALDEKRKRHARKRG